MNPCRTQIRVVRSIKIRELVSIFSRGNSCVTFPPKDTPSEFVKTIGHVCVTAASSIFNDLTCTDYR